MRQFMLAVARWGSALSAWPPLTIVGTHVVSMRPMNSGSARKVAMAAGSAGLAAKARAAGQLRLGRDLGRAFEERLGQRALFGREVIGADVDQRLRELDDRVVLARGRAVAAGVGHFQLEIGIVLFRAVPGPRQRLAGVSSSMPPPPSTLITRPAFLRRSAMRRLVFIVVSSSPEKAMRIVRLGL
jgi:hypothetical protein